MPPGVPPDEGEANRRMYYTPAPPTHIYDPVIHSKNELPEHEHQITSHKEGTIENADKLSGPRVWGKGDEYTSFNHTRVRKWEGEQWQPL